MQANEAIGDMQSLIFIVLFFKENTITLAKGWLNKHMLELRRLIKLIYIIRSYIYNDSRDVWYFIDNSGYFFPKSIEDVNVTFLDSRNGHISRRIHLLSTLLIYSPAGGFICTEWTASVTINSSL